MYLIDKLNAICATLGGTTTHKYSINALNEWCILAGGVGGHVYDIAAYNELAVIYGASGGHKYNINALNAIDVAFGGAGAWVYDVDALASIGSLLNHLWRWMDENLNLATPVTTAISEMQLATESEQIVVAADRDLSSDTGFWTKNGDAAIAAGVCTFTGMGNVSGGSSVWPLYRLNLLKTNTWYKVSVDVKTVAGLTNIFYLGFGYSPRKAISVNGTTTTYTWIEKSTTSGHISIGGELDIAFQIDNISWKECGWENATEIYDYIYAAQSGPETFKETEALKAAAFWCNYDNDTDNGTFYGKLYNGYALALIKKDIDAYNIANPATPYEFRETYEINWSISQGVTKLNAGYRSTAGLFAGLGSEYKFWNIDSTDDLRLGKSIRLIRPIPFDKGKLIFTYDDGFQSVYNDLFPLFQSKNAVLTEYLNGANMGTGTGTSTVMTWAEAKEMSDAGFDMQDHTYNHVDMTTLTQEQLNSELNLNAAAFVDNGLPTPEHVCYPYGYYNYNVIVWSRKLRKTGRTTLSPYTQEKIKINLHELKVLFTSNVTTEQIKTYMDDAVLNKKSVILYGHSEVGNETELIDYARAIGMDIITIKQLYNEIIK